MSVIDEIRSRVDLAELVGASVKLTRSGRNYKGLSPFKTERSPSFYVFADSQTYKDFSSGEQGDCFSWLMKKDGLTFKEALRELAQRAGVKLEEKTDEQRKHEDHETRLRAALAEASGYYHRLLMTSPNATECLRYVREKRALQDATIATWQLGFSLNDYHAASNFLQQKGFQPQELVDAGLMIENDEGRRYDRFRGRLMIPICDERGRVCGFGSRSLDGSEPKYMNSPQTPVFDKGRTLFGLDRARVAIRSDSAGLPGSVIVEGYMDVIGVAQAGFANVVSAMGTALTEDQFKTLRRLHPRIVLALDPDAAGQRAVMRGLEVARETLQREEAFVFDPRGLIRSEGKLNADIRVALMPDGKDPDELVLEAPERWRDLIQHARPVAAHVIDVILGEHDLSDPKGKSLAVQAVAPIIKDLSDPVLRDEYVQQIGRRLQLNPRAVAQAMGVAAGEPRRRPAAADVRQTGPADDPERAGPQPPASRPRTNLEQHFVALLARKPELLTDANVALTRARLHVLGAEDFVNPALRAGFVQLSRVAMGAQIDHDANDEDWLALISDQAPQSDDDTLLREEAVRTALRMREASLGRDQDALAWRVQQAGEDGEPQSVARYNRLAQEAATSRYRAQKALRLRSALIPE